jgi:REP element-mobilizing transposase RayT
MPGRKELCLGRNPRCDEPDSWHHVMNRGIARRTLFETESDIRFFLSRVAQAARAGRLEVHAFCILSTHFHCLVRSPIGELSGALCTVQNEYVRRFNRSRRRDGPLMRGRFRSRVVRSLTYRKTLVRYIDDNPVAAGLVPTAILYPHGSARHHVEAKGSPWLARDWIEQCIAERVNNEQDRASAYREAFGAPLSSGLRRLVARRLAAGPASDDPLDELFAASAAEVQAWMRRKAALADGTRPGIPLVDPETVHEVLANEVIHGAWKVRVRRKLVDGWALAKAGLLRDLCASTFEEAGRRCERSTQGAADLYRNHRWLLQKNEDYAVRVSALTKAVMSACHGSATDSNR